MPRHLNRVEWRRRRHQNRTHKYRHSDPAVKLSSCFAVLEWTSSMQFLLLLQWTWNGWERLTFFYNSQHMWRLYTSMSKSEIENEKVGKRNCLKLAITLMKIIGRRLGLLHVCIPAHSCAGMQTWKQLGKQLGWMIKPALPIWCAMHAC